MLHGEESVTAFNRTYYNKKEPAQSKRLVHYTKQKILFYDTQMDQSLTNHLPYGWEYLPGVPVMPDYLSLLIAESPYPFYILENDNGKQQHSSNQERYYEIIIWICVYLHLALLFCLVKNLTHIDNQ
jgi:hypothetical protein